jgi:hypothetical protein
MAKKIVLGLVLALIVILAVAAISAVVYISYNNNSNIQIYYKPDVNYENNDMQTNNMPMNDKAPVQDTIVKGGCYEEIIQTKDNGNCIGEEQTKKLCYKNVVTCSGEKTVPVPCYDEVSQTRGNGECIGVSQEKGLCYKQIVTCSGEKTVSIDCYPEITQEKGYGECIGLSQEKGRCYRTTDYSKCN